MIEFLFIDSCNPDTSSVEADLAAATSPALRDKLAPKETNYTALRSLWSQRNFYEKQKLVFTEKLHLENRLFECITYPWV